MNAPRPSSTESVDIPLTIRTLEATDLPDLGWTGGEEHLRAIAGDLGRAAADEISQLVVSVPNGCLVAFGAVDFTTDTDAGRLWMLSVRPSWQSLGIGTALITALESEVVARGRSRATIAVEHDNPRARELYLRLGYRSYGSALDRWSVGRDQTYVTVTDLLHRFLDGRR